jgi:hypothetical protein
MPVVSNIVSIAGDTAQVRHVGNMYQKKPALLAWLWELIFNVAINDRFYGYGVCQSGTLDFFRFLHHAQAAAIPAPSVVRIQCQFSLTNSADSWTGST